MVLTEGCLRYIIHDWQNNWHQDQWGRVVVGIDYLVPVPLLGGEIDNLEV